MRTGSRIVSALAAVVLCGMLVPQAEAQQNKADAAVQSDIRNLATVMETFFTDHSRYPHARDVTYNGRRAVKFLGDTLHLQSGDRLGAIRLTDDAQSYCLHVVRTKGASQTTRPWSYVSDRGGMRRGTCPSRFSKVVVR